MTAAAQPVPSESLASLLPILDAFNHRHRNQHHASHWWSGFRLLRRSIRLLAVGPSRRSEQDRAGWIGSHAVPRCYLTADNQHASLGLLLLAVLARLSAILSTILPEATTRPSTAAPSSNAPSAQEQDQAASGGLDRDRGTVVSRQHLAVQHAELAQDRSRPKPPSPAPPPSKTSKPNKKRKKRSNKDDELSSLFGSLS
ncbi:hypothetical protein S40285_00454 [Stachybotrys chlorohalonatus IBT 40285]|uniref:RNase MRP protein 1 RNA binding domain-containing protein n=1 Tax=Stachybotrys chlorohalonatus (strain IBT 40285) TaxID=1283841 RepID=A0A084QND4_STAC4|nr:hypothetical protein S40285_00454 [Stachybotrys chlorohalonata IBT 40285]